MVQSVFFNPSLYLIPLVANVPWTTVVTVFLTFMAVRTLLWHLRIGGYGNRYIFVTGCDTGFGADLVKRLDQMGFSVFAGCLTSSGFERYKTWNSKRVMPVKLDVTDLDSIRDVVKLMTSHLPQGSGLWGLVNNAGILPSMAPLELTPLQTFQRTIAVNLIGQIEVTRACLPLVRRSRGRIINMSSIAGRLGFTSVDYTVSKYGVEGFSDCLRREVHRDGVRVSIIAPGGFKTNLINFQKIFDDMEKAFTATDLHVQEHFGEDYVQTRRNLYRAVTDKLGFGSSDINTVTDVYVHALTARFPRTRYVVGMDANMLFFPLSVLPDCVADLLLVHCYPFNKLLV